MRFGNVEIIVFGVIAAVFIAILSFGFGYETGKDEDQNHWQTGYNFGFEKGVESVFKGLSFVEIQSVNVELNETKMVDYLISQMEENEPKIVQAVVPR